MSDTARGSGGARSRVHVLDALRGLMILLMVAYHLLFDLVYYWGLPMLLIQHPLMVAAQHAGAGVFILMSGATALHSRSNAKRGLRLLLAAAAVSLATWVFDHGIFVRFGILHFLGVSSLIYAALRPVLGRIPRRIQPFLYGGLFFLSFWLLRVPVSSPFLYPLGFDAARYPALDYFPLLPWLFVWLFGTWFGHLVFEGRLPSGVYAFRAPWLEWAGRWSLVIYLLHQPLILLVESALRLVRGG